MNEAMTEYTKIQEAEEAAKKEAAAVRNRKAEIALEFVDLLKEYASLCNVDPVLVESEVTAADLEDMVAAIDELMEVIGSVNQLMVSIFPTDESAKKHSNAKISDDEILRSFIKGL